MMKLVDWEEFLMAYNNGLIIASIYNNSSSHLLSVTYNSGAYFEPNGHPVDPVCIFVITTTSSHFLVFLDLLSTLLSNFIYFSVLH